MSRDTALVSADWAEKNLDAPGVVFVEVDEDTSRLRRRPHPRRRQARLEDRPAGPGPPGLRQPAAVRGAALRAGHRQRRHWSSSTAATTTGSPRTRTGTSSSTATATSSCSTAVARSGSWTPARWSPRCRSARPAQYVAQEPDPSIRAFRDEVVDAIGTKNLVDVRIPGRVRRPAARPRPPAAGAGAAGRAHPDRDQRAVDQGGQRGRHLQVRRRAARRSTRRPGWTTARRPSPTAGSASVPRTPGSCCRSCSATAT